MEKLNSESLMIGDWVYNIHNRQNERVEEIGSRFVMLSYNDLYEYDEIEPIPLTKDILIKNGFSSLTDEMFSACETETYSNQELKIYLSHIGCEYNPVQLVVYMGYEPQERVVLRMMPCQYVHELQHAFRLCKIKKEIKL
jgi:hypothetical protein